jgi:hypothetical protein
MVWATFISSGVQLLTGGIIKQTENSTNSVVNNFFTNLNCTTILIATIVFLFIGGVKTVHIIVLLADLSYSAYSTLSAMRMLDMDAQGNRKLSKDMKEGFEIVMQMSGITVIVLIVSYACGWYIVEGIVHIITALSFSAGNVRKPSIESRQDKIFAQRDYEKEIFMMKMGCGDVKCYKN